MNVPRSIRIKEQIHEDADPIAEVVDINYYLQDNEQTVQMWVRMETYMSAEIMAQDIAAVMNTEGWHLFNFDETYELGYLYLMFITAGEMGGYEDMLGACRN